MDESIKILIADDEPTVREALVEFLCSAPSFEVVGSASDADEAIDLARAMQPDIAVVDVKMPGGGGPRATTEIRAGSPRTTVIALSAYEDRATVLEMLRCGAAGYLVKGVAPAEILDTLREAGHGRARLSADVASFVVDELRTLLERSEQVRRELKDLGRVRGELVQTLSHELLTPSSVIQATGQILAAHGTTMDPAKLAALTSGVGKATRRLRRLVENLDLLARLQTGDPVPGAATDMRGIIDRASASVDDTARIRVHGDALDVVVSAEADHAARALTAVLENALDLSEEAVDVTVCHQGTTVDVEVSDRGVGIPDAHHETIFEPFFQLDSSTTRTHGGLGVGLHLAQLVMRAYGGSIDVGARKGGGSTFRLTFPIRLGGAITQVPVPARDEVAR